MDPGSIAATASRRSQVGTGARIHCTSVHIAKPHPRGIVGELGCRWLMHSLLHLQMDFPHGTKTPRTKYKHKEAITFILIMN